MHRHDVHPHKQRREIPIHLRRALIDAVIVASSESDLAPTEVLHRAAFLGLKQLRNGKFCHQRGKRRGECK